MADDGVYRINTSQVVFESFEEEIVLINLDNGNYYSLSGSAADIWRLIERGVSIPGIVARLGEVYHAEEDILGLEVERFIGELGAESLIVPSVERSGSSESEGPLPSGPGPGDAPFLAPRLERYTDMQDLLLLDPIHDVDESGWPKAKREKPER